MFYVLYIGGCCCPAACSSEANDANDAMNAWASDSLISDVFLARGAVGVLITGNSASLTCTLITILLLLQ